MLYRYVNLHRNPAPPSPLRSLAKNVTPAFSILCALSKKLDSSQLFSHQSLAHSFAKNRGVCPPSLQSSALTSRLAATTQLDAPHQTGTTVTVTPLPSLFLSNASARFPSQGGGAGAARQILKFYFTLSAPAFPSSTRHCFQSLPHSSRTCISTNSSPLRSLRTLCAKHREWGALTLGPAVVSLFQPRPGLPFSLQLSTLNLFPVTTAYSPLTTHSSRFEVSFPRHRNPQFRGAS